MVSKHIISRKNSGGKSDYTALEPDLPLQQRTAGVLRFVRTDEAGQKEVIWHTPYIINNDYMYGEIAKIAKEVPDLPL